MSMKSGASEDPFADDDDAGDDESAADQSTDQDATSEAESSTSKPTESASGGAARQQPQDQSTTRGDLPYIVRRKLQDKPIQHERDRIPFYLREVVQEEERDFKRDVEGAIGTELPKADLREAAYRFAMRHPDEVAAELERMGYNWE